MTSPYRQAPAQEVEERLPPHTHRFEEDLCNVEVQFCFTYGGNSTSSITKMFHGDDAPSVPKGQALVTRMGPHLTSGETRFHSFLKSAHERGYLALSDDHVIPWHHFVSARVTKRVSRPASFLWRYEERP